MKHVSMLVACLGILAGCTPPTVPVPFGIERLGTLPDDRYPALEALAASEPPQAKTFEGSRIVAFPEPFWVYSVDPTVDVRNIKARIGRISGNPGKAADVAGSLLSRLMARQESKRLFPTSNNKQTEDLVIDGVVIRADTYEELGTSNSLARTQMELTLRRDEKIVGAIQLNSVLFDQNWSPNVLSHGPLGVAIMGIASAASGSREGDLEDMLTTILSNIADGKFEGVDTQSASKRYLVGRRPEAAAP